MILPDKRLKPPASVQDPDLGILADSFQLPSPNSLAESETVMETRETPSDISQTPPYTIFERKERLLISILIGFTTMISPLTVTVYLPLLPTLRSQFSISSQAVNMTLTIYIFFQALSPAIFGPLSDLKGRKPVYLLTLTNYAPANLGMALNKHNYAVLLLLRALQSLGASAAFAISYGIVADICVPSERGKRIGWVGMTLNLGTCVGPILGGTVAYLSGECQWVFWGLFGVGLALLVVVGMFLPETAREIVGNGSKWDANLMHESWIEVLKRRMTRDGRDKGSSNASRTDVERPANGNNPPTIKAFLAPARIIFYGDAFLCLWIHGSFYAVDYALAAAVPDIYKETYNFNPLYIGLAYLPRGIGIILGGYINGRTMGHNYWFVAKRHNYIINKLTSDDITKFPLESEHSRGSCYLLIISTATLIGYGWAAKQSVSFVILLVLQFVQGFWGTCFYTIYNTLLVDSFPHTPGAAAACASITRCAMAAVAVSILEPLLRAASLGRYFTVLGLWSGLFGGCAVWALRKYGLRWRRQRLSGGI